MLMFMLNIFVGTRHHQYVGIDENFNYAVSFLSIIDKGRTLMVSLTHTQNALVVLANPGNLVIVLQFYG